MKMKMKMKMRNRVRTSKLTVFLCFFALALAATECRAFEDHVEDPHHENAESLLVHPDEVKRLLEKKEVQHICLLFCSTSSTVCGEVIRVVRFLQRHLEPIGFDASEVRFVMVQPGLATDESAFNVFSFPELRWFSLQPEESQYTMDVYSEDLTLYPRLVDFVSKKLSQPLPHLKPKLHTVTSLEHFNAYARSPTRTTVLLVCASNCASLLTNVTMASTAFNGDETILFATCADDIAKTIMRRLSIVKPAAILLFPNNERNMPMQLLHGTSVQDLVNYVNPFAAVTRLPSGRVVGSSVVSLKKNHGIEDFVHQKGQGKEEESIKRIVEMPAKTLVDEEYHHVIQAVLDNGGNSERYHGYVHDNLERVERLLEARHVRALSPRAHLKIMIKQAILLSLHPHRNEL